MTGLERLQAIVRRRSVRGGLAAVALGAWIASGIFTVPATSVAVLRRFGAVTGLPVPPGVHWWWPWPVGQVDRAAVTRTFALPLGFRTSGGADVDPNDPVESRWLTGDTNIVHVRSKVSWRIGDPAAFLFRGEQPERVLRLAIGAAFTEASSARSVDDVLTSGRLALREEARTRAQAMLDAWQVGIQLLAVDVEAVDPPTVVRQAFQGVQDARADRERAISDAQSYANTTVPLARGEAEKRILEARAFADQRLNAAHGDADRFGRLAAEHARAPALLEKRLYLETVERVLPRVRRYVLEPGGEQSIPIRILE